MMRRSVTIRAPEGPVRCGIVLPPSKSVANRALVLASLAGDIGCVKDPGTADDIRILRDLLTRRPATMHCGDGGTTLRFLLAWACVQEGGGYQITGNERLLQRPHGPLVQALRELGADLTPSPSGFRVRGRKMEGGAVTLHSPDSSQFLSALLLVAARFSKGLELAWTGMRLSSPYVRMTMDLCRRFGVSVHEEDGGFRVEPGPLHATTITVAGDWSAAAFWYQIALLSPEGRVQLEGLSIDGLQGDEAVAKLLSGMLDTRHGEGRITLAPRPGRGPSMFTADLAATPDLFQALAFTMAGLGIEARFTGLHNLPLKETDRLKAVADALEALGCTAQYNGGTFSLQGSISVQTPPPFDPQGDHRMAMSLAPLALVCHEVTILDPEVVNKSYPGYWDDLSRAGFRLEVH